MQTLNIAGTGLDPENYTVVMDFWLEDAKRYNEICLEEDTRQDGQLYFACDTSEDETPVCLNMLDIMDPTRIECQPAGFSTGAGCAHDGGPLWISIPIQTEC